MSIEGISDNQVSLSVTRAKTHSDPVARSYYSTALRYAEVFLLASALALCLFWYASWKTGSFQLAWPYLQGQKLVIRPQFLNLGVRPRKSVAESSVEIANIGSQVVTLVGAQPSCGCLTVSEFPIEIPPGTSHTLLLKLSTLGEAGNINHTVKIFSDCPQHTISQITVSGVVE